MTVAKKTDDKMWFKGYGDDQYICKTRPILLAQCRTDHLTDYAEKGEKEFLGGTFAVESYQDLEKAQKLLGGEIEEMKDAPGGGHILTLKDPEGFPVNLIYGQEPAERGQAPPNLVVNFEMEKPRKREFQRFTPGPAAVHKVSDSSCEEHCGHANGVPSLATTASASRISPPKSNGTRGISHSHLPISSTSQPKTARAKTSASSCMSIADSPSSTTIPSS